MKKGVLLASVGILALMGPASARGEEKPVEGGEKVSLVPRITGMVNLRYIYDESDKDESGFDVRRVRLGAKGELHKKLDYVFQAEYASNVRILDAYFRWKIRPEFNLQVGQFKVHYSMESLDGPASWLTAENPAAVNKLNAYSDLSGMKSNGRDIGLMVYGATFHQKDFDVLRYRLGFFNGNGYNLKDNNRKKDVAAMVWLSPIRHLSFTGSYYAGSYGKRGDDHVRNRASSGVEWKDAKLTVRSEYLFGKTGPQRSHGAYVQTAYLVHPMVQPVLSYDYFKQDADLEAHQHNMQVGLNVLPIKYVRVQASYIHTLRKGWQNPGPRHNNLAEIQIVATY